MTLVLHPGAEEELDAAAGYYEACQEGFGLEFSREVDATLARITEFPNAWMAVSKKARRCLVNRFPFGVIYQIKPEGLWIIAVASLNQHPDYWRDRSQRPPA